MIKVAEVTLNESKITAVIVGAFDILVESDEDLNEMFSGYDIRHEDIQDIKDQLSNICSVSVKATIDYINAGKIKWARVTSQYRMTIQHK